MMARSPYALVFCDTSFFYASLDRRDRDHLAAKSLVEWVEDHQVPMMTTWEVVVETVTLLRYRFHYQAALTFIQDLLPQLNFVLLSTEDRAKALEWFKKLSKDKTISLCDAISYFVVRDYLNFVPCLAFDDDFEQLGLLVLKEAPSKR